MWQTHYQLSHLPSPKNILIGEKDHQKNETAPNRVLLQVRLASGQVAVTLLLCGARYKSMRNKETKSPRFHIYVYIISYILNVRIHWLNETFIWIYT